MNVTISAPKSNSTASLSGHAYLVVYERQSVNASSDASMALISNLF